jgi:hypothetical protein
MKRLIKLFVSIVLIYLLLILIFNKGKFYQRKSLSPNNIEQCIKDKMLIDSIKLEHLNDFKVWRSRLTNVKYYGLIPIFKCTTYSNEVYCITIQYKKKDNRHLFFKTNKTSDMISLLANYSNYHIVEFNEFDSTKVVIFEMNEIDKNILPLDSFYIRNSKERYYR